MANKRSADKDINHDNWDEEDESEEVCFLSTVALQCDLVDFKILQHIDCVAWQTIRETYKSWISIVWGQYICVYFFEALGT